MLILSLLTLVLNVAAAGQSAEIAQPSSTPSDIAPPTETTSTPTPTLPDAANATSSPTAVPAPTSFLIFKGPALNHTRTVTSTEVRVGKTIYQVFWSRTGQKRELFRMNIGQVNKGDVEKLLNHDIHEEIDLNGDGLTDYSWYGDYDSGDEYYLLLSSPQGYRKVDLVKTLKVAWRRLYHHAPPDFYDLEPWGTGAYADCIYGIRNMLVQRSQTGLLLTINVSRECYSVEKNKGSNTILHIPVEEAQFEYEH